MSLPAPGKQAIEVAAEGKIDLAILDVRMPGMDGIELAKRLREGTSFPFLFLSVYGDVERVRRAADYGALG